MANVLTEHVGALRPSGSEQVFLILDASESAADYQQALIGLVDNLLRALPAQTVSGVYFLGDATCYPPNQFTARAAEWVAANRTRASLITPVFSAIAERTERVVALGCGLIFDLPDWDGSPILARTLLVNLGVSLQSDPMSLPELSSPGIQPLMDHLFDPITQLRISGPAFMPSYWDHPGYRLVQDDTGFALVGERLESYMINMRFWLATGGNLQVIAHHASGKQTRHGLLPVDPAAKQATVGQLTPDETRIFLSASKQRAFTCPQCGLSHPWDTLRCLEDAIILGEVIYPTLQRVNGFVLFRAQENAVHFQAYPCSTLRLGAGKVAIREGQRAPVYHFDLSAGAWVKTPEQLRPYQHFGEGRYALLV